jgi:hypothetical protein
MRELDTFQYSSLDDDVRPRIEAATDRLRQLERRTGEAIIEIGRILLEVKDELGHGQFGAWINAEFGWSEPTAQRFMRVADVFQNRQIDGFQPSALYALASGNVAEPIREEFIERAEAGETIRHKDVKERISQMSRHTPDAKPPQRSDHTVHRIVDEWEPDIREAFGEGIAVAMSVPVHRTSMQTISERLAAAHYELSTIQDRDRLRKTLQDDDVTRQTTLHCIESANSLVGLLRDVVGHEGPAVRRIS